MVEKVHSLALCPFWIEFQVNQNTKPRTTTSKK
jgi:hypothetical protein